jgi:hypothetical protein
MRCNIRTVDTLDACPRRPVGILICREEFVSRRPSCVSKSADSRTSLISTMSHSTERRQIVQTGSGPGALADEAERVTGWVGEDPEAFAAGAQPAGAQFQCRCRPASIAPDFHETWWRRRSCLAGRTICPATGTTTQAPPTTAALARCVPVSPCPCACRGRPAQWRASARRGLFPVATTENHARRRSYWRTRCLPPAATAPWRSSHDDATGFRTDPLLTV